MNTSPDDIVRQTLPLRLKMGFSNNPRLQPLVDGTVKMEHIELDPVTVAPATYFTEI